MQVTSETYFNAELRSLGSKKKKKTKFPFTKTSTKQDLLILVTISSQKHLVVTAIVIDFTYNPPLTPYLDIEEKYLLSDTHQYGVYIK